MKPSVYDESSPLKEVVLGLAKDFGPIPEPKDCPDPKSLEHVINGSYPDQNDLINEMTKVKEVLEGFGVKVFRPHNIPGLNQVFARDITFVIEDKILIPNILKAREDELDGIEYILEHFEQNSIIDLDEGIRAEGGDIMPWKEHLFIGYSGPAEFDQFRTARTNLRAVEVLAEMFPHRTMKAIELVKSDTDPRINALHLDCCFQPFGHGQAILYPAGMKHQKDVDYIRDYFGKENIIEVSQEEFYNMYPNIFSINPTTIISNSSFTRLNQLLKERGFTVAEVSYNEVSKMGGLLRCSTLPLVRE